MSQFKIGLSAQLYQEDVTVLVPEVDLSPLKNHPCVTLSSLPPVGTGLLKHADVAHLDAAILFLERITNETFGDDSNLTLLARYGVGYDTLDIPACTEAGVAVAIAPSGVRRPVATSVVALLLALTMNLTIKDRITRDVPEGWAKKNQLQRHGPRGAYPGHYRHRQYRRRSFPPDAAVWHAHDRS